MPGESDERAENGGRDEYHESEDEDYDPTADSAAAQADAASDDDADASAFAELQGSGGLVKTRAQRRAAEEAARNAPAPKKSDVVVGTANVDVDALWKEMNSAPAGPRRTPPPANLAADPASSVAADPSSSVAQASPHEEYITITRTFKFAGDVKTETKRVLRSSAEGQDFLRQQKAEAEAPPKKQLKSAGRGPVKRKMSLMEEYQMNKTKKITTLEKSRLDWLGFVDKEGIREDLTKHNKSGYLDRQDFLDRADRKLEHDLRQQRVKRMQQQQQQQQQRP